MPTVPELPKSEEIARIAKIAEIEEQEPPSRVRKLKISCVFLKMDDDRRIAEIAEIAEIAVIARHRKKHLPLINAEKRR